MKSFRVHHCARDPDCQREGAPNRWYWHTPFGSLIVGLDWESRTQLWLPFKGYTWQWWPVVWHPSHEQR